ncbi:hypothetical protein D3C75_1225780 [compost metagenome]
MPTFSTSRNSPPIFIFTFSPFIGSIFSVVLSVKSTGHLSRSSALPVALTIPCEESTSSASSFREPSMLLTFSNKLLTSKSVSPVRRSCEPRNS